MSKTASWILCTILNAAGFAMAFLLMKALMYPLYNTPVIASSTAVVSGAVVGAVFGFIVGADEIFARILSAIVGAIMLVWACAIIGGYTCITLSLFGGPYTRLSTMIGFEACGEVVGMIVGIVLAVCLVDKAFQAKNQTLLQFVSADW